MSEPRLLEPLEVRGLTVRNRIWLPAMCQYSIDAGDGVPTDWQLVHLGARAVGGFGLLITEATAVSPEGRITPQDAGIWNEAQREAWSRITAFVHGQGASIAVQLAHAGRKGSTFRPWAEQQGTVPASEGGWETVGPSTIPFPGYAPARALGTDEAAGIPRLFADAAVRAASAGFDAVEIHAAHGYLLHEFLSPLSNDRTDRYGGDLAGRARLLLETVREVRSRFEGPVLVRLSATDWTEGGLTVDDTEILAGWLREAGADLLDISTGGNVPARIPARAGYQVFAAAQVRQAGLPVAAVGLITSPEQAEQVLADGAADAVLIGRGALDDPSWGLHAVDQLSHGHAAEAWPPQLVRGRKFWVK
ncbi:MAG: NADH:flavin oxidoreductase/NADH oxidase [Microbacteriaceae bacterium]|jgi:2,4-dienoyl-CoA reductase-like NADH-dependent reductase (Old Yellow Enzyme family)|nr:NADH:flavin oxidoreductase/NADH oxidase [Microbacteriaceae bacterium]MCI1207327.1 NADH:flavin oxidoreductase/NADH oxidase [Microbacteriaceae bacterium]